MMNDDPHILFLAFDGRNLKAPILDLLDCPSPTFSENDQDVKFYHWLIDNKYYTSSVKIVIVKNAQSITPTLIENIEALILFIDFAKNTLEEISSFWKSLAISDLGVKLLVCDRYQQSLDSGTGIVRQWCIENGWELVELNPEDLDEGENEAELSFEDDFADSYGIIRIKQALHAHTWSNLVLKDKKSDAMNDMLKVLTLQDSNNRVNNQSPSYEVLHDDSAAEEDLEEVQMDNFESLLSSFGEMKNEAMGLNQDERKQHAERVTLAFWRALGGDEDEIQGLDLSSDKQKSND